MDSRREFFKKSGLLVSGSALFNSLPAAIQKALAINPAAGSTFEDAEHIVLLMQENRSFDHCFGTLQGVRGFNDPRAIEQPNKNPVWLQTNKERETYAPFRLDIKDTKATWMSSLPHGWTDQTDARNNGHMDKWLDAKRSGNKLYANMPLTMGFYNRQDLPFYYALADAFTVCDQHFCSSLTGTTPNRLYFWTGNIRKDGSATEPASVRNSEVDYGREVNWGTFPEKLEAAGVSWKIYQNEISLSTGLNGEEDAWLANFTDNPIEWFSQYNVRRHPKYQDFMSTALTNAIADIEQLEKELTSASKEKEEALRKNLDRKKRDLAYLQKEYVAYKAASEKPFSDKERSLHQKAFTTNTNDPDYRKITSLKYKDGDEERETQLPKGDVLHQFRQDVSTGNLPAVSWLVAPENFSDHPGAPWFGAWYVSEVMDILTQNPEVWKKTIFILTYDENDGYFDHIPPFVAPDFRDKETGYVSEGIKNLASEYVTMEDELEWKKVDKSGARSGPIGLGFRVPMLVASPWSRGGYVNSQVFDHTSVVQFLEGFASRKAKLPVKEANITDWRRAVCGNLHSIFRPYNNEVIDTPAFLKRDEFIGEINNAKFKPLPAGFKKLSEDQIKDVKSNPLSAAFLASQEQGIRPSNGLPYELYCNGNFNKDKSVFEIDFTAANKVFGKAAAGSPLHVYAANAYKAKHSDGFEENRIWSYAVAAGESLHIQHPLANFKNGQYDFKAYGPNGYFRQFKGSNADPDILILCTNEEKAGKLTGNIIFTITAGKKSKSLDLRIQDNSYNQERVYKKMFAGQTVKVVRTLTKSHHWYDESVMVDGFDLFQQRFAGRVETGDEGKTDPLMGRVV